MIKAVFLDFYGTVVHEDGVAIYKVVDDIMKTSATKNPDEIGMHWWHGFLRECAKCHGESFKTQRAIEMECLKETIEHFGSAADSKSLSDYLFAHWRKPEIFEDAKEFIENCPLPVYLISNIDIDDINKAVEYHGLKVAGIITSEDAKSYKPRPEIFELALSKYGLKPNEVIHSGDSLSSDVEGATNCGIKAFWLNRKGKEVPEGVTSISALTELSDLM